MNDEGLTLDADRCVLIIQDLQNDVMIDGGAFAETGSPEHAKEQNVVANVKALAETCRGRAFPSSTSTTSWNRARRAEAERAALRGHEGRERARPRHMGRRAGGRARAAGRRLHRPEDAHERLAGDSPQDLLTGFGRDTIIVTGAWTNMSIEHTSRTGADKGYFMVVPEDGCSTMNADWHNASINYALQNVSTVTTCGAVTEALGGVPAGV